MTQKFWQNLQILCVFFRDVDSIPVFQFGGVLPPDAPRIGQSPQSSSGNLQSSTSSLAASVQSVSSGISSSGVATAPATDPNAPVATLPPTDPNAPTSVDPNVVAPAVSQQLSTSSSQDVQTVGGGQSPSSHLAVAASASSSQNVAGNPASAQDVSGGTTDPNVPGSSQDTTSPVVAVSPTTKQRQQGARPKVYSASASYMPPSPPTHDYQTHSDR